MGLIAKIPRQYTNPESLELELYRAIIQLSKLVRQINEFVYKPGVKAVYARETDFGLIHYGCNHIALDLDKYNYITIGSPSSEVKLWYRIRFIEVLEFSIPTSLKKGDKFNRVIRNKVSKLIEKYPQLPYKIFRMDAEVRIMFNEMKDYLNNQQSKN